MEEINQPVSTSGPLQSTLPTPSTKAPRWLKIIAIGGAVVWLLALAGSVIYLVVTQRSSPKEVACTQEAKQCPDGSYVSRVGPNCVFAPCPTSTFDPTANLSRDKVLRDWKTYTNKSKGFSIKYPDKWQLFEEISTPDLNTSYPYTSIIKGELDVQASVNIFVEEKTSPESFLPPETLKEVKITASIFNNNQATIATSQGLNMQKWIFIDKDNKTYILNAWGAKEEQKTTGQILSTFEFLDITNFRKIKLFYYNRKLDPAFYCLTEAVIPVEREIPQTSTPIQDTIELLIEGKLTNEEIANGFSTEFPLHKDFRLRGATLENGILTLDFPDIYSYTDGGSCRTGLLNEQVKKTAKQFSEVKEVKYTSEEMFQP